ncbi:Protocadherin alpha-8 [Schistosoma japonicum]|nr:Protocadherin alpha-8 [Schistosoma japonicum]
MFSILFKLYPNYCIMKLLHHTVYLIHILFFIPYTVTTFNPIVLSDNTKEKEIVSKDFLLNHIHPGYKLSLQLSKGREYFDFNENYQLVTSRFIDRDKLCLESRLCCPFERSTASITTITETSSTIHNIAASNPLSINILDDRYNYLSHETSSSNTVISHGLIYYHNLCSAKTHDTKSLYHPMCAFNLTVSVITSPVDVPETHHITIIICDENDNIPKFKREMNSLRFTNDEPFLITNLSEASPIGSRILLPLAEDLDSSPFNIQRYELESFDHSLPTSESSDLSMFQLNYTKTIMTTSGHPSYSVITNGRTESFISKLELVLLKPLNREEKDEYKLRILAIDGGQPSQTGTLYLIIRVLDINDHAPTFNHSIYEVLVNEGSINKTILQLSATDVDAGENAVIRYKFSKDSNWIPSSSSFISSDLENINQYPPSYWFLLDESTGRLTVQRPLDYETKPEHIFEVLAYNPPSELPSSNHRITSDMTATAKIIVKVNNEFDEAPVIQIDYSNEKNEPYKRVKENSMNLYFIAFIIATDPDYNNAADYHLHTSHPSASLSFNEITRISSKAPLISCKLETYKEFYSLSESSDNYKLMMNRASEVRYALQTIKPLDRELGDEDKIIISCTDSDTPPKTSTATVVVKIDDENDCIPEIHVSTTSLTSGVGKMYNVESSKQLNQQHFQHRYIPVHPWSVTKLTYLLENEQDKHKVFNSPIILAFLANISVYTVYIVENRPAHTLVALLNATDKDSGENGRVTYEMLQSYTFSNLSSKLSYSPHLQQLLLHQHNNINNMHNDGDIIEIQSKQEAFELFQLNTTHGDLVTSQSIDREECGILDEVFILIKATDHGDPSLYSFALLQVVIIDENDNAPIIGSTGPTFNIEENQPAGSKIGEIYVIDPDIFSLGQLDDICQSGGGIHGKQDDYLGQFYYFRAKSSISSKTPQQSHKEIQVRIDPGHGRRDLPFVLHDNGNGQYFLNTTRPLDRETEEAFKFSIIATDNEPIRIPDKNNINYLGAVSITSHRRPSHTSSLSVIVNVVDVNDNRPEIIFPSPLTSNSTVHRLSYHVYAGHEIISINANDRDADKLNGKFHFEMVPDLKVSDLFTIDRENGMLKTRRSLTKDDLGEYQVHILVRDEGEPPLETQLLLRLSIDQSELQWSSNIAKGRNYQFDEFMMTPDQRNINNKNNRGLFYDGRNANDVHLSSLSLFKNVDSNVILSIIIISIVIFILFLLGLCIYLRHAYNCMPFIPDIYDNKWLCCYSTTCILSRRSQSTLSSNIDEKPYLKNLLDPTTMTPTITTMSFNAPITSTTMGIAIPTSKYFENINHLDYRISTDLLKYKQTNFKLGSFATPVNNSPICRNHSVVHSPVSHHNINISQENNRNGENCDMFMDPNLSNVLVSTAGAHNSVCSFSNLCASSAHANYDSSNLGRMQHLSGVVTNSNNHRGWSRNRLIMNIPNIVNETNDTMPGSYYHFVPSSFEVGFPNHQSKHNLYRGNKPGDGLLHTYNVGEQHRQYDPSGRVYFLNGYNEKTPNANVITKQTGWDASKFVFRPIRDTSSSYQVAIFNF